MRDFLLSLRIRIKLLAAFGSILLLSVLLIIISIRSINKIIYYKTLNEEVGILKLRLETLDLTTREFMYEGYKAKTFLQGQSEPSITLFEENYAQAKGLVLKIIPLYGKTEIHLAEELDTLRADFHNRPVAQAREQQVIERGQLLFVEGVAAVEHHIPTRRERVSTWGWTFLSA